MDLAWKSIESYGKLLISSMNIMESFNSAVNPIGADLDGIADKFEENIDDLDKDILDLVIKRMDIVDAIAKFKKNHNVTILQAGRWEKMLEDRIGYGAQNELTEKFIYDFFKAIHAESINKQSKIMNK